MSEPSTTSAHESGNEKHGADCQDGEHMPYQLRLFVAGASTNSIRAITNLKHICETYLPGQYLLEVIDVHQQKQFAEQQQLIALPILIKSSPQPERRLIGDMSDTQKVLRGLGLTDTST